MRINVYAEELTNDAVIIFATPEGRSLVGVRLFLESPDALHNTDEDDDRNAITLWSSSSDNEGMSTLDLASLLRSVSDKLYDAR